MNYYSINLMGNVYKIIAKILVTKLQEFLPSIKGPTK
jgi:hypothetical protein